MKQLLKIYINKVKIIDDIEFIYIYICLIKWIDSRQTQFIKMILQD